MTVAEVLVQTLLQAGVDMVFSIPGGACSALSDALLRKSVKVVVCQSEAMAGYLAAGYYRATRRPGVVVVTSGPGVLATAPSLAAAHLDHDGVVVLAGDVAQADRGRGTLQDGGAGALDIQSVFAPLVSFHRRIDRPHHAQPALALALSNASGHLGRPSLLEIPIDVQQREVEPMLLPRLSLPRRAPDGAALHALLDILGSGKRPTLFVGRGVGRSGAGPLVSALSERLGAPILVDAEGRGCVAADHPLLVGTYGIGDDGRGYAWIKAHPPDPLFVIGARLDDTTTAGFSKDLLGGRIVQLDEDPLALGRALPITAGLGADLVLSLRELLRSLPPQTQQHMAGLPGQSAKIAPPLQEPHITPPFSLLGAARALRRAFPEDTTFSSDIGNHLLAALREVHIKDPDHFHVSLGLGGMGSGIGLAIGLSFGGRENVVGICGDGGLLMFGNELYTAVQHERPLVLSVFQDGQLGMVRHGARRVYGASAPYPLAGFDIESWARGLGADVLRVEHPDTFVLAAKRPRRKPLILVIPIDPESHIDNPRDLSFNFSPSSP